jgi:diaminopimelate decarboxylase
MFHFAHDARGRLLAEAVPLADIAHAAGTPSFVYAEATLSRHFRVFDEAFAGHPHLVCYAMKASSNTALLSLFARMGSGADIVSGGELLRALAAGIPADRIVFSGVGKTRTEMESALAAGILSFNVESEAELRTLDQVACTLGQVAPVSLRVNPNVDAKTHPYIATGLAESKFGIPVEDARRIAGEMKVMRGVKLRGLDCHIGSQITSLPPLVQALDSILALADSLSLEGHEIHEIDLGGGLGITYAGETPPLPSELGAAVVAKMRGRKERLILEPGRVIVGNAGILLTRVLYLKETKTKTFVIVDAAMNDLIRPSLYKAHHEIWPVERREPQESIVADVVGPVCESSDVFAKDRTLQRPREGDLLAIMSAGAYGFSMSSTYNSRPRAAEILVNGAEWAVVREREKVEALMEGEALPPWFTERR